MIVWSLEYPEYAAAIAKYPRAFQNGACFPDWGYVVGASNAAEAAHWVQHPTHKSSHLENCRNSQKNLI